MTVTAVETWQTCRFCDAKIQPANPAQTYWVDVEGWDQCIGTEDSHAPRSVCRVVDQITEWVDKDGSLNVHEGDLVLHDYHLEVVERIFYSPPENMRVRVEFASRNTARWFHPADLIAVRRYLTEETP